MAWLLVDRILLSVYPLSWGGPNIGGGALSLLAQLAVVSGVAMLTSDRAGIRQSTSPRGIPAADGRVGPEPGRPVRVVTLLVDGALVVALIVVCFATPGDARNAGINGAIGLTRSADGTPALVLQVCSGSVDRVSVFDIDPSAPPSGWTGKPVSLPAQAKHQLLLIALADGHHSQLHQVSFTAAALAGLAPGTVLYSAGPTNRRVSTAAFRGVACN